MFLLKVITAILQLICCGNVTVDTVCCTYELVWKKVVISLIFWVFWCCGNLLFLISGNYNERTGTARYCFAATSASQFLAPPGKVAQVSDRPSQEGRALCWCSRSWTPVSEAHRRQERGSNGPGHSTAWHATWYGRSTQDGRHALCLCMFYSARRCLRLSAACEQQCCCFRKVCSLFSSVHFCRMFTDGTCNVYQYVSAGFSVVHCRSKIFSWIQ